MTRSISALLLSTCMLAACATGRPADSSPAAEAAPKPKPEYGTYGFDTAGMDPAVAPGDDFYRHANGVWADTTPIPADKSNYGLFTRLDDLSKERTRAMLDELRDDRSSSIGNAYASYLDEATVETRGLAPVKPWLDEIRAVKTKADFAALAGKASRNGVSGPFGGYVGQDDKAPDQYIFSMYQGGLGMPDRDYYLTDSAKMKETRAAYVAHLARLFTLAGEADAQARAQALMALETQIARAHWTRIDSRDADKVYNKMTLAELQRRAPGFDFKGWLAAQGLGSVDSLLVAQPTAVTAEAALIAKAPIGVLKDMMLIRSLDDLSDYLPDPIADESFAFHGTVLNGTPEREPRWKRAVDFVKGSLGDEVGKLYVARYFPPEAKVAADEMVRNILAAMGRRIDGLEWMSAEAKQKARAKLAAFKPKIGYPDRWRDYSGLTVARDDLFGNALRSRQFEHDYNIGKLGKPIYTWEWFMTPMEVNAYANFGMVEIVFPAAILQPPFFDPHADPAINYGGIGAVIGHEISHHFDDQGAKYDATGRLAQWWTEADVARFKALTDPLVAQYDAYEPLPGEHVQGQLTLGENIADLAGLTVAHEAYLASLGGKPAPVIDGTTGDQRFYLGWAQVWRRNVREEAERQRLLTDPHSPSRYRVAIVRNLDPWYAAFQIAPGAGLHLPPEKRVKIW